MTTADAVLRSLFDRLDVQDTWDQYARGDAGISTPLAAYRRRIRSNEEYVGHTPTSTKLGFAGYLNAVTANPSDPLRTALITRFCVFPSAGDRRAAKHPIINASAAALDGLAARWIADARALADAFVEYPTLPKVEPRTASRFASVAGDRGVGKTFLQNYIASKYCATFDEARVLWVRISLVREFDSKVSIDYWIKAQITKILGRYYDPQSHAYRKPHDSAIRFDMDQVLRRWQTSDVAAERERVATMLRFLRLEEPANDRDIGPNWIPLDVAGAVFNAAVEQGIGFVVALDGLDLLGNTEAMRTKYEETLAAVGKYLRSDSPLWRYHLVFLRDESLWDFDRDVIIPLRNSPEQEREIGEYDVAPVSLNALYQRRLDVLESEDIVSLLRNSYKAEEVAHFRKFLDATLSGLYDKRGEELRYTQVLKGLLGTNTRAAMQLLHAAASEYADAHSPGHYLLTDRLMRLGRDLPPAMPTYRIALGEKGQRRIERQYTGSGYAVYDATFLPSVFRFPYDHGALASDLRGHARGQLLMGLRILQLAAVMEQLERIDRLDEDSLVDYVAEIFKYDPLSVRALVEEFIDEEILQFKSVTSARAMALPNQKPLRLAPKGVKILDGYLFDPTYLNVSAFQLPVPETLAESRNPMFVVVPLRANSETADIVYGKLVNAVAMAKLIRVINREQAAEIAKRRDRLDEKKQTILKNAEVKVSNKHGGLFSFDDRVNEKVNTIGARILASLAPEVMQGLVARMRRNGLLIIEK